MEWHRNMLYFHEHFVLRKKCFKKIETVKLIKNGMYLNLRTGGVITSYYPEWALYPNSWVTKRLFRKIWDNLCVWHEKEGLQIDKYFDFPQNSDWIKFKVASKNSDYFDFTKNYNWVKKRNHSLNSSYAHFRHTLQTSTKVDGVDSYEAINWYLELE